MAIRSSGETGRVILSIGEVLHEISALSDSDLERRFGVPVFLVEVPEGGAAGLVDAHELGGLRTLDAKEGSLRAVSDLVFRQRLVVPFAPVRFNANPARLTVGRSTICDVWIPFAGASKIHALVERQKDGTWAIQDAGSTNGTVLEGRRLMGNERSPLAENAVVLFGNVAAQYRGAENFRRHLRVIARQAVSGSGV